MLNTGGISWRWDGQGRLHLKWFLKGMTELREECSKQNRICKDLTTWGKWEKAEGSLR